MNKLNIKYAKSDGDPIEKIINNGNNFRNIMPDESDYNNLSTDL